MSRKWTIKNIDEVKQIANSYMTKEEFINMLQNLNFTHIENYDIEVITGFYYRPGEKEDNLIAVGYELKGE